MPKISQTESVISPKSKNMVAISEGLASATLKIASNTVILRSTTEDVKK